MGQPSRIETHEPTFTFPLLTMPAGTSCEIKEGDSTDIEDRRIAAMCDNIGRQISMLQKTEAFQILGLPKLNDDSDINRIRLITIGP